jgi:apolipoprotein D and lipocalin family protein
MKLSLLLLATLVSTFAIKPETVKGKLTTGCKNHAALIENTVNIDADRYEGLWFEQLRYDDVSFEKNCYCTEANYTVNYDGSLRIENTCRNGSPSAPPNTVIGHAITPYKKHQGFLLVSFGISFIKGPYAIVDTDYDNYAIVASCPRFFGKEYVWVLTREHLPSKNYINKLKNITANMGFESYRFTNSYQNDECYTLNYNTNDDCCLDGDCCHGVEYCCDTCNGSCRCSVNGKCY